MNSSPRLIYLLLPQHFDRRQFLVERKPNGQNYVLVGDVEERQRALSLFLRNENQFEPRL